MKSLMPENTILAVCVGTLLTTALLVPDILERDNGQRTKDLDCSTECPEGTRVVSVAITEYTEAVSQNAFVWVDTQGCESTCAPVVECVPPNVPSVTKNKLTCQGLEGFAQFDDTDQVDMGFGTFWDESRALADTVTKGDE